MVQMVQMVQMVRTGLDDREVERIIRNVDKWECREVHTSRGQAHVQSQRGRRG